MCCFKNCSKEHVVSVCVPIELMSNKFRGRRVEKVCYLNLCEDHLRVLIGKFVETLKKDQKYSYDFLNSIVEDMQVSPNG